MTDLCHIPQNIPVQNLLLPTVFAAGAGHPGVITGDDRALSGCIPPFPDTLHGIVFAARHTPFYNGSMSNTKHKTKTGMKWWLLLSAAFLVLIAAVVFFVQNRGGSAVQERQVTLTDVGFDTPVTLQATCSEEDFDRYTKIVSDTFLQYDAYFDQYTQHDGVNGVYTLNQQAATNPVKVDDAVLQLLQDSMNYMEKNPKFDITEGKVLSLWHDAREAETPYVPDDKDIQAAKVHTGLEGIEISGNEVSFKDDTVQLDLGAIAKGFTAGVAAEKLHEEGLDNGYINAGGNVVLLGEKPDGKDWVIGIQSPDESGSVVQLVTKDPVTMVTSGDYQRYFEVDGKRYSHIVDPDTGYPVTWMRSVTVIGPADQSEAADANSTTLFLMPVKESMEYAEKNGIEAVWITDKGEDTGVKPTYTTSLYDVYVSDGLQDVIRLSSQG